MLGMNWPLTEADGGGSPWRKDIGWHFFSDGEVEVDMMRFDPGIVFVLV